MIQAAFEQSACFGYVSNGGVVVAFFSKQPEGLFQDIIYTDFLLWHERFFESLIKSKYNFLISFYQTLVWLCKGDLVKVATDLDNFSIFRNGIPVKR